jgi:hypothetical protein
MGQKINISVAKKKMDIASQHDPRPESKIITAVVYGLRLSSGGLA